MKEMFASKDFDGKTITLAKLNIRDVWAGQALLLEIMAPLMGGGLDEKLQSEDAIIYHKSTFFKDSFSHMAKMISDPRMWDLIVKMLNKGEVDGKQLTVDYFDADIELFNEVVMWALEVNFQSFFGEQKGKGMLGSLTTMTMGMMGATFTE